MLAPCALGGVLDDDSVPRLSCRVVAGAANNQLADDRIAELLARARSCGHPISSPNAGGLINIAEEQGGYDPGRARRRVRGIGGTLHQIFDHAEATGLPPLDAALEIARTRLGGAASGDPRSDS